MPPPAGTNAVSQVGTLVVTTANAAARVSQIGTLAVVSPNAAARISQTGLLVVVQRWEAVEKSHFTTSFLNAARRFHTTDSYLPGGGLASYWKLDETATGGTFADIGYLTAFTQDVNGTSTPSSTAPIAAPVKFTNPRGRFFPFNSTYLDAFLKHAFIRNFTVSAWVRAANPVNTPVITHQDPTSHGWGIELINAKATFSAYRAGVAYSIASLDPSFNIITNVWTHVAIVTTVTNRYVYTNGRRADVTSTELPGDSSSLHTLIGKNFVTGGGFILFQGDLDDIRIYTLALTDDQIQTLAYGTFDPFAPTVVIKTHLTNSLLRRSWHFTDALIVLVVEETHLTNAFLALTFRKHFADTAVTSAVIKLHVTSTNVLGNLVGHWRFDETGSGQTLIDSSPLGAHAPDQWGSSSPSATAPVAAPVLFTNPSGRYFPPPPNSWFNAGVQAVHGFTQNFTVACWVRKPTSGVPLISHQSGVSTTRGWGLAVAGSGGPIQAAFPIGTLAFQSGTASGLALLGADAPLLANVWVHVAVVASTTNIRLFVSGKKQSAVLTAMPAASTDLPTYIGRDYSGTGVTTQYSGDMDDARIYRVALTDDQLQSLAGGAFDPFAVTVVSKTHGTDISIVSGAVTVITTHLTNTALVAVTEVITTHTTDTLLPVTVIKTHLTNATSVVVTTVVKTYLTDTTLSVEVMTFFRLHNADVQMVSVVIKQHTNDSAIAGMPAMASFVQRDTWRNGINWIGPYGTQGYSLSFDWTGIPGPMPPGVSFTTAGGVADFWAPPGVYNDPRLLQIPATPTQSVAMVFYTNTSNPTESITFLLDDGLIHNISIYSFSIDDPNQSFTIAAYDAYTHELLSGPYLVDNVYVVGSYMSWNVKGHVQFDLVRQVNKAAASALFIDPPRTVVGTSHNTSTLRFASVVKNHTTDSSVVAAAIIGTRSHTTNTFAIGKLIGWWKLDETGTGQVAVDSSPVGANATDTLGTTTASTPAPVQFTNPGGRHFLNDTGYLDAGVQATHSFTKNFTVACWVRVNVRQEMAFVTHQDGGLDRGWGLLISGFGTPVFQTCSGGYSAIYADNQVPLGVWTHVLGIVYPNTNIQLYTNGKPQEFGTSGAARPSPDLPTYIGRNYSGTGSTIYTFQGDLDDVRIYNVALTNDQIQTLAYGTYDPFAVTVVSKTHTTNSSLAVRAATVATFVQRDNWKNGQWIGYYGNQGYAVFGSGQPDVMPSGVSYTAAGGSYSGWFGPGIYSDPRLCQVPNHPEQTLASVYQTDGTESFTFLFDDGKDHSVAIFCFTLDAPSCRLRIEARDADTNALLDTPQYSGDYCTTSVYMVWNARGHVRFDVINEVAAARVSALFIDPQRSATEKSHATSAAITGYLVAWWKLDETGTGQTAIDSSPVGANATDVLANTTDSTPAPVQFTNPSGRHFSGSSGSYLNAGVQSAHNLIQNFTVSLWARAGVAIPGQTLPLIIRSSTIANSGWTLVANGTTVVLTLMSPATGGSTIFAGGILPSGVWTHLAFVVYTSNARLFYAGRRWPNAGLRIGAAGATIPTRIGVDDSDYPSNWYVGDLDDVRIYNVALTDDQVQSLAGGILDPFLVTPTIRTHTTSAPLVTTKIANHTTDSATAFPLSTAVFVQRDNWRNGINWIGNYGSQGYAIVDGGVPDVLPAGISYSYSGGQIGNWAPSGVYSDPRYVRNPIDLTKSTAGIYWDHIDGTTWVVLFDDELPHALTFYELNADQAPESRQFHINIYDNRTNALLSGPHAVGDFYTTGVYMTWNVSGHIRVENVIDVGSLMTSAMFIDPPRTIGGVSHTTSSVTWAPPSTAVFVQRDNWRNGAWKGAYGSQGVWVIGSGVPVSMPPGASFSYSGFAVDVDVPPGVHTDPRFYQIPGDPVQTMYGRAYTATTGSFVFLFEDGLSHAVTISFSSFDAQRLSRIEVYNNTTGELIAVSQDTGDYQPIDVHMTWNVTGRVRFDVIVVYNILTVGAIFVDPPRTVGGATHSTNSYVVTTKTQTHTTDIRTIAVAIITKTHATNLNLAARLPTAATFVQRDNWREGTWIGHYGTKGYAVFGSGVPDLIPVQASYSVFYSGGAVPYQLWAPPGPSANPHYPQVPGQPANRVYATYLMHPMYAPLSVEFHLDDGFAHSVSLYTWDWNSASTRQLHVDAHDATTNALLDSSRSTGDFFTTGVYLTWNVSGRVRFDFFSDVGDLILVAALFVDPPRSVSGVAHATSAYLTVVPTATFVQRDNWRNGAWKGHYGTQGNWVVSSGVPIVMPPGVSFSYYNQYGIDTPVPPGVYTDPRYYQVPGDPVQTVYGRLFSISTMSFLFLFDDSLSHSVSISFSSPDAGRLTNVEVYDNDTSALLDASRSTGNYQPTDVYMTWNVSGHVRFDIIVDYAAPVISAVFVDPPRTVGGATHRASATVGATTATFVQRDNWRSGRWIGHYGTQGYAVFNSGVPDLMPPQTSYTVAGLNGNSVVAPPGIYPGHPEYAQIPGDPIRSVNSIYLADVAFTFTFILNDGLTHAISLFFLSPVEDYRSGIEVYNADTNVLLAASQSTGPNMNPSVYLTWNVSGHLRFKVTMEHNYATTSAIFIDPPRTVAGQTHRTDAVLHGTVAQLHTTDSRITSLPTTFALFVQRDNWRNGTWISHYGTQGYSLFLGGYPAAVPPDYLIPDVLPPATLYTLNGPYAQGNVPAVYTDPRLLQDPTRPGYSALAWLYNGGPADFMVVLFDDGLVHSVSLYNLDNIHTSARFNITVYDNDTGAVLDGPREVGDYYTTGVYMTWNVRGHIRFHSITEADYAVTNALFIDPPRLVAEQNHRTNSLLRTTPEKSHSTDTQILAVTNAAFVQRDNWRNGTWIGHYGTQGYDVNGCPALMPSGVSYTSVGFSFYGYAGSMVSTDLRRPQDPSDPTHRIAYTWYTGSTGSFTFLLDDGHAHSVSIFALDFEPLVRRFHIQVYDADTNALIAGRQDSGDYGTKSVYMTWNARGHVRFDITDDSDNGESRLNNATIFALFVDPPKVVGTATHTTNSYPAHTRVQTHGTSSTVSIETTALFVHRDNWHGGGWIGTYGTQGYAVFLSTTPDVMPSEVSYKVAGGKYSWWLPPGTYTDPRLPQVPGQPDKTVASVYATDEVECFFCAFDDGLEHAISIFSVDYDLGTRRHQIEVYNDVTNELLDGPRDVGDQYTNSVYMTWNVRGHIRFELVNDIDGAIATALFIDPPITVGGQFHSTDSAVGKFRSHMTSTCVGVRAVSSRSRSQRVGTRTLAFGDSL